MSPLLSSPPAPPLAGRRIVVTRAREQAGVLVDAFTALGAEVVSLPVIRITDAEDPAALRRAAERAGGYDWIVFTSANGVERFWAALEDAGGDASSLAGARVCAIGPATAAELARRGAAAEVIPGEFVAEAAVEAMAAAGDLRGRRVLLPRAAEARAVLPDSLRALGAEVDVVAAYRTVRDGEGADAVRRALDAGEIDAVTFTASSTVRHFAALVGTEMRGAKVASIGPVTSATLRELGVRVDVEAKEYTIPGLVGAVRELYRRGEA